MSKFLAQDVTVSGQKITGPLVGIHNLGDLVSKIANFVIPLGIIVLFFILVWGGYDFLISRGNAEKVKSARAKITAGIIGFVLLVLSYLIVRLVSQIFGLGEGLF